jgi:hypothetical protein
MRLHTPGEQRERNGKRIGSTNDLESGFTPIHLAHVLGPAKCHNDGHEPEERFPIENGVYSYRCSCGERVRLNERKIRRVPLAERGFTMFDFAWAFSQIPGSTETLAVAVKYHAAMLYGADRERPEPLPEILVEGIAVTRLLVDDDAMQGSEDLRDTCEAFGLPWWRRPLNPSPSSIQERVAALNATIRAGDIHMERRGIRIYFGRALSSKITSMHEVKEALKASGIGAHTTVTPQEQRRMLDVALCDYVERTASVEVPDDMLASTNGGKSYDGTLRDLLETAYEDTGFQHALNVYVDFARVNGKEIVEEKPGLVVVGSSHREVDFGKATLIGEKKPG